MWESKWGFSEQEDDTGPHKMADLSPGFEVGFGPWWIFPFPLPTAVFSSDRTLVITGYVMGNIYRHKKLPVPSDWQSQTYMMLGSLVLSWPLLTSPGLERGFPLCLVRVPA